MVKKNEVLWKCITFDKLSNSLIQSELSIETIQENIEEFEGEIQIIIFALSNEGLKYFDTNKKGQFADFLKKIKTNEIFNEFHYTA